VRGDMRVRSAEAAYQLCLERAACGVFVILHHGRTAGRGALHANGSMASE